jgi:hypothetical protein
MKSYLMMMLSVAMMSACTVDDKTADTSPIIEANAILYNNNLPVDGCAEHISLLDTKGEQLKVFLPTEATKPLFTKLINAEIAKLPANTYTGNLNIPVSLKYRITQQKDELMCGWGKKSVVEQIEILAIIKK